MFEKRTWVSTDSHPGASDLNRIENGIEDAHKKIDEMNGVTVPLLPIKTSEAQIIDRVKHLELLPDGAKVADVTKAFNDLLTAIREGGGSSEEDKQENGE